MNRHMPGSGRRQSASTGVASLSWYEIEETRAAVDELWRRLASRLRGAGIRDVPDGLARGIDTLALLHDPKLMLTQTCGFVAAGTGHSLARIVATPCYEAPGCGDGTYTSLIVVRDALNATGIEQLRGTRLAVSDPLAHSGCNAIRALVAPLHRGGRFFSEVVCTGSHQESIARVAAGGADVAAIDCVTFEVLRRFRPRLLAGTRVLGRTAPAPAPPFVTRAGSDDDLVATLRRALTEVIRDPSFADLRPATLLRDVTVIGDQAYARLPALADEARALEYTELEFEEDGTRS